jgi:subtilisin family serine protease
MAAAHVSGVIALLLEVFPNAKPADLEASIKENAFKDVLIGNFENGSPNLLLRTLNGDIVT